jgi:hypothetical protein
LGMTCEHPLCQECASLVRTPVRRRGEKHIRRHDSMAEWKPMTAAQHATPQTSARPNILYVHIDNLGMGELGSYGGASRAAWTRCGWIASHARGCSC